MSDEGDCQLMLDWMSKDNDRLRAENEALKNVLEFYADPDTYFAISFFADNRAGEFLDDFSEDQYTDFYGRPMPGKRARAALRGEGEK